MSRTTLASSPFPSVLIIGVGLIGGSLGLAIRRTFKDVHVVGYDRRAVLKRACEIGAVQHAAHDLHHAVGIADLVILALPAREILRQLKSIAPHVPATTLVTDTGSVKREVLMAAQRFFPKGNFIGGHPMAGSERSGIEAAHPLLFENAFYVLSPMENTPERRTTKLETFLAQVGARVVRMEGSTHDAAVAALSHVPQLAAVALMRSAGKHRVASRHLPLGAGGFRDMTRIASSPFGFWGDILESNRRDVRHALKLYRHELDRMDRALRRAPRGLSKSFKGARELRAQIPAEMKGFLHTLTDVQVFVEDRPGALLKVLRALATAKINVKDIELVKVREGLGGTFRLWFESPAEAKRAKGAIGED
ncbi:MAG: prephenate dehydrogenase [Bacteroidetes bacterium]|jgi:prephenate dehydrogenase|nr:prephenate dehydrogenase [Bacteroidota bacterium]